MSPALVLTAVIAAAALVLAMTGLSIALVFHARRTGPALGQLNHTLSALRLVLGVHRDAVLVNAQATVKLAGAQESAHARGTLEAIELDSTGCCRGPLPDADESSTTERTAPGCCKQASSSILGIPDRQPGDDVPLVPPTLADKIANRQATTAELSDALAAGQLRIVGDRSCEDFPDMIELARRQRARPPLEANAAGESCIVRTDKAEDAGQANEGH